MKGGSGEKEAGQSRLSTQPPSSQLTGSVRDRAIEIITKEAEELGYCEDDVAVFRRGEFDGDDLLTLRAVERALSAQPAPALESATGCKAPQYLGGSATPQKSGEAR